MKPLYLFIVPLALSSFILLSSKTALTKEALELHSQSERTSASNVNLSFCTKVRISRIGAICESPYGFTARLDFPHVDMTSVLAGEQFFPKSEAAFSAEDHVINGVQYRNINFVLRWESTTPDFLQVYMKEIEPAWEGKGIPYRLLWRASYETCSARSCETWTEIKDRGEYSPLDIPDLPDELAADSNFNGVPASFWNTNLTMK
jgi:hypothetical protein